MSSRVSLTGDRPTRELPKITKNEPVTVAVARSVRPGREACFEEWAHQLLSEARGFEGYLGGGVLSPGEREGEHQVIVKFRDAKTLRTWERSSVRADLLVRAEDMVSSSRAAAMVGSRTLVEMAERAQPERRLHLAVAGDTLWVLPVAVGVGSLAAPLLGDIHYVLRTLVITSAITLAAHVVLNPLRRRIYKRRRGL
jgi:antibiotic biosynthesis monooxygenase (ABM) superfamily enzyme